MGGRVPESSSALSGKRTSLCRGTSWRYIQVIGKEFDISHRKLRKYNELPKDYVFRGGEIVYLEEKRRRATKDHIAYVVRSGDSMYSISQKFGVRLERLYKMNNMDPDSPAPKVGDILRLR